MPAIQIPLITNLINNATHNRFRSVRVARVRRIAKSELIEERSFQGKAKRAVFEYDPGKRIMLYRMAVKNAGYTCPEFATLRRDVLTSKRMKKTNMLKRLKASRKKIRKTANKYWAKRKT